MQRRTGAGGRRAARLIATQRRERRWRWCALACAAFAALLAGFTAAGARGHGHSQDNHGYEVTTQVFALNPGHAGEHGQAGDHGQGAANGQGLGVLDLDDRLVTPAPAASVDDDDMSPGRRAAFGQTDLGLPLSTPTLPSLPAGPPEENSSGPGGNGNSTTTGSTPAPAPVARTTNAPPAARPVAAAPRGGSPPAAKPTAAPTTGLPPLVLIPPLGLPTPPSFNPVSGGVGALPLLVVVIALVALAAVLAVRILRKSR
jgi:hypothetical protein